MSRSYRKPYAPVCGVCSAKYDKRLAARSMRRAQNHATKKMWYNEDVVMPHRLQCANNDVWGWLRDGKKHWMYPDARDWQGYIEAVLGVGVYEYPYMKKYRAEAQWPPYWYIDLLRK